MDRPAPSDPDLLAQWLNHRRESAFRSLVGRYGGLVQATARRTCGDAILAAEASQLTFITLAHKAESLRTCASLGGWLHLTALLHAKNLLRKSRREARKRQQLVAAMETPASQPSDERWQELRPVLDESLAALSEQDREALILRFYRSLSVREVAETLGIATEAAKKRIARATDRLRAKLARRGCHAAAAALPAALLAGFVADAQAALPMIAPLSAKALASGTGAAVPQSAVFTAATLKTPAIAIPAAALLAAGIWIGSQFLSIAGLERRNALLRDAIAKEMDAPSARAARRTAPPSVLDQKPVDWAQVANQLRRTGYFNPALRLVERVEVMEPAELVEALDEIAVANLTRSDRDFLELHFGRLLIARSPGEGMTRFVTRCHDSNWMWVDFMSSRLTAWLKSDPDAALAWFQQQIAAGSLVKIDASSRTSIPEAMVTEPFYDLLSSHPETAGRFLAAVPPPSRVLRSIRLGEVKRLSGNQPSWATIMRSLMGEASAEAITWPIFNWSDGDGSPMRLDEIDGYMERINATSEELAACILAAAGTIHVWQPREEWDLPVSIESVEILRGWVAAKAPDLLAPATVRAVQSVLEQPKASTFPELAALVTHYHAIHPDDGLIVQLLKRNDADNHQPVCRLLATQLTDPVLRRQYLETFK